MEDARAGDARAVEVRKGKGRGWKVATDCLAGVTERKFRVGREVEARAEDARAGDARAVEVRKGKERGWKVETDCVAGVWFTKGIAQVGEGREVEARAEDARTGDARAVEVGKGKGRGVVTDRVAGVCFKECKVRVRERRVVGWIVTEGGVLDISPEVGRLVDFGILESLSLAGSVRGVWPDDVNGTGW